jgi:hypothetical protein
LLYDKTYDGEWNSSTGSSLRGSNGKSGAVVADTRVYVELVQYAIRHGLIVP